MTNAITDYLKEIGKRGGDKTAKRGKAYYQEIGRRGALRRWGKVSGKTLDSESAAVRKTAK
jgi:hypothetical protein